MSNKEEKKRIFPEIDARLYKRIKKLADKSRRTVSKQIEVFIEDCLEHYLEEQEARP